MALDLGVVEAVRAAEAGSDIGGDTIMVPADVTSSNAGPVEVERLGEVDELAAEAQDLSSRGSDGGEDNSSQPVGGRAREAHFFSLPVAENSEPPVAAALDAGAVLEAPATRGGDRSAIRQESCCRAAVDKDLPIALLAVRPAPPHAHAQPVYRRRSHFFDALLTTDHLRHAFAGKPVTRSLAPTCHASGQA